MRGADPAYYLYCLVPSGRGIQASATGVDGRHVTQLRARDESCAAYCEVDLDEFVGERADAQLQDLKWLGPRVCRHEAVIEEIMRQAPVLPARFATLFSSLESLDHFVLEHREGIAKFFAELGGQQEWAVKGLLDRAGALEGLCHPAEEEPAGSLGGRYLQERRMKAQAERELNQRLKTFCQHVAAVLGAHAGGFRERKVVTPAAEEATAEVVLNWAFLVPPEDLEDFKASLQRFNNHETFPGLALAVSGPWPPYSFVPDLSGGAKA
ncbi:MAG: GvpL/GvpF family gas vesicle protein [Acidobacteriaceae bacterium]|jgi:hypothetical protein